MNIGKPRLPVTSVVVFGASLFVALAVGAALYLGFGSAFRNTQRLMSDQAHSIVESIESVIAGKLNAVDEQGKWIADGIASRSFDSFDKESLDEFMLGALAATPHVAGIAVVTPDLESRRWARADKAAVTEDWSSRPEVEQWVREGATKHEPAWIDPFFTSTINSTVLLRDRPLFDSSGKFLGMLGQIVPIGALSREVSTATRQAGMTPFVLFGRDLVLAHPELKSFRSTGTNSGAPLPELGKLEDPALRHIWTAETTFSLIKSSTTLNVAGTFVESVDRYYFFVYREVDSYGQEPWTIGVHVDAKLYGGPERLRMVSAFFGGLGVLFLASLAAILLGRRMAKPIRAIANVAHQVNDEKLGEIDVLPRHTVRELDDASRAINKMVGDLKERQLIRQTLGRFVPEAVARTLLSDGGEISPETRTATVLYSDIAQFTDLTESLGPEGVVDMLNAYFSAMVEILERHRGVVTQFQGDAILATFNVPIEDEQHAANAINAAYEMLRLVDMREFRSQRLNIRIGVNTGTVVAGAVGAEGRLGYTVHGDSVNLAARLESLNKTTRTRLLISENTATLAGSTGLVFVDEFEVSGQSLPVRAWTDERLERPVQAVDGTDSHATPP